MSTMLYLADRAEVAEATALITRFGDDAGLQAAARADESRDVGNVLHFCRWRQIERLILFLSVEHAVGTIH